MSLNARKKEKCGRQPAKPICAKEDEEDTGMGSESLRWMTESLRAKIALKGTK
jgi:hypothetical protein